MRPLLALLGAAAPAVALACAACARDQGRFAWLMVGALLATPYLVVVAIIGALRRAGVLS